MTARLLPFALQLAMWGHAEWGVFRPLDACWEDGATWSYGGHRLWDGTAADAAEIVIHDPGGGWVPAQLWRALPYVALPHGHAHPGGRL